MNFQTVDNETLTVNCSNNSLDASTILQIVFFIATFLITLYIEHQTVKGRRISNAFPTIEFFKVFLESQSGLNDTRNFFLLREILIIANRISNDSSILEKIPIISRFFEEKESDIQFEYKKKDNAISVLRVMQSNKDFLGSLEFRMLGIIKKRLSDGETQQIMQNSPTADTTRA